MSINPVTFISMNHQAPRETAAETPAAKRKRPRIAWIDTAKAFAMLLVIFGHLTSSMARAWLPALMPVIDVIYLFHMPLFFVLSGLTFHVNKSFKTFAWQRFRRLVIPYYFFALYFLLKIAVEAFSPALFSHLGAFAAEETGTSLSSILLGEVTGLWFFFALFWADVALFAIMKMTHESRGALAVTAVAALAVWYVLGTVAHANLPFQLVRAFEGLAFVALGRLVMSVLEDERYRYWLLIGGAAIFADAAYLLEAGFRFGRGVIFLLAIVAAVAGSAMTIGLSQIVPANTVLTFIGINTIIFYGFGPAAMAIIHRLVGMVIPIPALTTFVPQLLVGLLIVALVCALCAALVPVFKRWLWWGIGADDIQEVHSRNSADHAIA